METHTHCDSLIHEYNVLRLWLGSIFLVVSLGFLNALAAIFTFSGDVTAAAQLASPKATFPTPTMAALIWPGRPFIADAMTGAAFYTPIVPIFYGLHISHMPPIHPNCCRLTAVICCTNKKTPSYNYILAFLHVQK